MADLLLFNKPYGVLSQFTDTSPPDGQPRSTLADYLDAPGFRVAGRLDYDSEGLLLLTDDGVLQQRIANPRHKLWKTYWVQVEGEPDAETIARLSAGVELKDGPTLPARAKRITPPDLWPRIPPVRVRRNIPDTWLELAIREGRNRQVRRMTAAVGHPTLRLVRATVGDWQVLGLAPGPWRRESVHLPRTRQTRPGGRKGGQAGATGHHMRQWRPWSRATAAT